MKFSIVSMAILCQLAGVTRCVNPGLQIRISQTGLDYGAGIAVDILSKDVLRMTIPDQSGSAGTPVGKVKYWVNNMKVTNFIKPSTSVTMNPGSGLTWSLSNAGVSINGNWRYKYLFISDSGSFYASANGVSISVSVSIGQDITGHPTIHSTGCSSHINSLDIRLHGGASWLYQLFVGNIERPLKSDLERLICDSAKKAIDNNAAKELATLPVQVVVDREWLFDYRLVSAPQFASGYMETFHKGEFFFNADQAESPFVPEPFSTSSENQMVTIWASEYVLNTVGYVFYKHNILHYILTKKDLPEEDRGYLNTTCNAASCFGSFIPNAAKLFPGASVEIEMAVSASPTAEINTTAIFGNFVGNFHYRARLADGSLADLFTTSVVVKLSLNVTLQNLIIKGKINKLLFDISVTDSKIGVISNAVLNLIFNFASSKFIIPNLNKVGEKGIPLPSLSGVTFTNTKLVFDPHNLRLLTDVKYSPNSNTLYFERKTT